MSANATKLYGMGLRQAVRRSTALHNERRDWRICADFAAVLTVVARLDIPAWPLQFDHVAASLQRFQAGVLGSTAWLMEGTASVLEHHKTSVH